MKNIVFLFCVTYVLIIKGQDNMVQNYSFEVYTSCPTNTYQIHKAKPWIDPSTATSDYFHKCDTILGFVGVPNNRFGYQYAKTGFAYAGLAAYWPSVIDYREYIQSPLSDTLKAGTSYCIQFFASLADTSRYAVNRLGLYLSSTPISCSSCVFNSYIPQIESYSGNFLLDTASWMKISGLYTANGTEAYITLGNFRDDANTDTWVVNSTTNQYGSYYYLDDVSIVALRPVNAGIDDTICQGDSLLLGGTPVFAAEYLWQPATGLDKPNSPNPKASPTQTTTYVVQQTQCSSITYDTVTVFVKTCPLPPDTTQPPEPFILPTLLQKDEYFVISGLPPGSRLWVYDIAGRLVYHSLHYRHTLHSSELATGMYLIRLQMPDGTLLRSKLMVVK